MQPSLSVHIHLKRNGRGSEQLDVCNFGASHNMQVKQWAGRTMGHRNKVPLEQQCTRLGQSYTSVWVVSGDSSHTYHINPSQFVAKIIIFNAHISTITIAPWGQVYNFWQLPAGVILSNIGPISKIIFFYHLFRSQNMEKIGPRLINLGITLKVNYCSLRNIQNGGPVTPTQWLQN